MKWSVSILLALCIASASQAADYVWLEGETPSSKNYPCGPAGVERPQFLSGGAWLSVSLDRAKIERSAPRKAS
jgi:hypothetical protein